jgi:uncharacterized membrane protein/nitrite reductase/ring-hydroxylating ferredoxin subunit
MRSTASFKGHPIHPMLIPFPFAFLTGAFVFDAAGWWLAVSDFQRTGAYIALAGIGTALLAAVPGFIDYLYTVPPESSGKKRATKHMAVNLTAVALFAAGWFLRGGSAGAVTPTLLALEFAAVGLLMTGGYMGGTLVYRNMSGVDHRYADTGKWSEQTVERKPGEPIVIEKPDDLEVDQMRLLLLGDRRLVLARTESGWAAFDDHCTHRGGSLAGGVMICGTVQCLWHGSQYDVTTGKVKSGPAKVSIGAYKVETDGKQLRIHV